MKTINYVKSRGLTALCDEYKIIARRHREFPNLIQLKYDQRESPMAEPIVQECRGLIVDESDNWRIVAFPFRKFFNHGEPNAAPIDWPTARVYEKLDGSLMILYWYAGAWRVASSGLPDAAGDVNLGNGTFAELFWKTHRQYEPRLALLSAKATGIPGDFLSPAGSATLEDWLHQAGWRVRFDSSKGMMHCEPRQVEVSPYPVIQGISVGINGSPSAARRRALALCAFAALCGKPEEADGR